MEKLWKMFKNIGTLNLQQQKNRETILCQNQTIIPQNYHTTKVFAENLLTMKMRKTQILLNSKFWV